MHENRRVNSPTRAFDGRGQHFGVEVEVIRRHVDNDRLGLCKTHGV
jgi:hypothetical protein